MFYLLLFLCGCLTGVSAVLFGFGGGFVVVPLLYHLLQLGRAADDPLAQAAMSVAEIDSEHLTLLHFVEQGTGSYVLYDDDGYTRDYQAPDHYRTLTVSV